jgi:hypothetical protein
LLISKKIPNQELDIHNAMAESGIHSAGLSIEKAKSEAKFFGIASAVLLGILFFVPVKIIQAFALLGLAATSWQFLFHGATSLSMSLVGVARRRFQITVAVVVPLLLSLYFIKDVTSISLQGVMGYMFSPWFLIPLGIIAYVSWVAADQLNPDHPFRGFLIACAVIFVICFMGHNGIYSEYDDYTESSSMFIDKEAAKRAAETGRYHGQFLVYVVVSYAAMLTKLLRRTTPNKPVQPTR